MPLLWVGVALVVLRGFEIGPFANLSWWWPVGVLAAAAIWFEWFERRLGRDRRQVAMLETERRRRERVERMFGVRRPRR